ncbi:MAG: FAD-dependent oxidoreductase, partial [Phycisphaeraceae bacterium]
MATWIGTGARVASKSHDSQGTIRIRSPACRLSGSAGVPMSGGAGGRDGCSLGGESRMRHYDCIVIGTGPAGQKAAIQAAKLGKRVAIIEKSNVLGGVQVNTGTIPSK